MQNTNIKEQIFLFKESLTIAAITHRFAKNMSQLNPKDFQISENLFLFHEHLYFRNCIIELSKLVSKSKNERTSIFKILNIYEEFVSRNESFLYKKNSARSLVEKSKNSLSHFKTEIDDINNLRDKMYAHNDVGLDQNFILDIDWNWNRIEELLNKLHIIIKEIQLFGFGQVDLENDLNPSLLYENDLNNLISLIKKND